MIKTYISTLMVVLMALAQMANAQDADDMFGQMDAGSAAADEAMAPDAMEPESDMAPAEVEDAAQAPAIEESEMLSLLLEQAEAQYRAGEFAAAIRTFDAMLAIDRYNTTAMKGRERASKRIGALERKKQGVTRKAAMTEVRSEWNQEARALGEVLEEQERELTPEELAAEQMVQRLKGINIPIVDFADSTIEEVILFLTESSRTLDANGKGVNILLVGMDSAAGERTVTTVITDISLFDALQVVSEMASLKFEVKANAVAVMPANYTPVTEMVMKSYDIIPEVGADLQAFSDDSGGMDDLFGDDAGSASDMEPVDVAAFFSIVDFPEGAEAIYRPRFRKLFVKNTEENHKTLDDVLFDLNDRAIKRRSQQVQIEAKFVEFNEGALEELGFDWTIYGNGTIGGFGFKDGTYFQKASGYRQATLLQPDSGPYRAGVVYTDPTVGQQVITRRPGQNLFGAAQRYNGDVGGGGVGGAFQTIQQGLLKKMGGPASAMVFGNDDVDVRIAAMEQEGTADVLSAPRVTTKSGSEAIIRVAETHRYPMDWDVETGQRTSPVVKPQDWEDYDLGVSLSVTPIVDLEGDTIELELTPEIVNFKGYDEYIVGFNTLDPGTGAVPEYDPNDTQLEALMAFFERRSISTQVTIADGHTVVMGGLVDETTETFRDQVPILGDIPFVGRLFRTEGSRSAKQNLTIFVTATQVDVNGMTSAERELARQ